MIKIFKLREDRGFSLVELMIVVAIIAILAAIAVPAFMKFAMKSKTSEAIANLNAIRTCQEAYRAENDVYLDCPVWPVDDPTSEPRPWPDPAAGFDEIGFEPDGDVRYTYQVIVGVDANNAPNFTAIAKGDLDDDKDFATFTIIKGDPGYPKAKKAGGDF